MPISGITNKSQNIFWLDGYFFNATIHSPNNISITVLPLLVFFQLFVCTFLLFGSFYSLWLVEIQSHPEQISLQIEKQHYFWFFVHSKTSLYTRTLKIFCKQTISTRKRDEKTICYNVSNIIAMTNRKNFGSNYIHRHCFFHFFSLKQAKFEQNKNFIFYTFLVPKILPVCDGREEAEKKLNREKRNRLRWCRLYILTWNFVIAPPKQHLIWVIYMEHDEQSSMAQQWIRPTTTTTTTHRTEKKSQITSCFLFHICSIDSVFICLFVTNNMHSFIFNQKQTSNNWLRNRTFPICSFFLLIFFTSE